MAWRQHAPNAVLSRNTNVYPAFGNEYKIERNRRLTGSIMRLNYGTRTIGTGLKPIESMNDPSHRPPEHIMRRAREEISIAGRTRGYIRPAAPGQVRWKNPYWRAQRPPARSPIGPFTQGSLEKQSVLSRMSTTFSKLAQGAT